MRIGTGYDVHRLVEGRKLILGGVEIPYEKGLHGHSDADVLLHAIMDALLGAAALGDIGKFFPDTDPEYEGADSLELMREVRRILEKHFFLIENVDATIIAQAPKMRPYIDRMRQNIAQALDIDLSQVSVKATTEEHLGFTGRGEGISVQAVALITSPMDLQSGPAFSPARQTMSDGRTGPGGTGAADSEDADLSGNVRGSSAGGCAGCPVQTRRSTV